MVTGIVPSVHRRGSLASFTVDVPKCNMESKHSSGDCCARLPSPLMLFLTWAWEERNTLNCSLCRWHTHTHTDVSSGEFADDSDEGSVLVFEPLVVRSQVPQNLSKCSKALVGFQQVYTSFVCYCTAWVPLPLNPPYYWTTLIMEYECDITKERSTGVLV